MNKRTIITILIAVLVAAVIGTTWYVFFHKAGTSTPPAGTFGSGGDRTPAGSTANNQQTNIPNRTIGQQPAPSTGNTVAQGGPATSGGGLTVFFPPASSTGPQSIPDVSWLSGGGAGGNLGGGAGSVFSPTSITQLNNGQVGGQVNVLGTFGTTGTDSSNGSGLAIGAIAGVAAGCLIFMAPSAGSIIPSIPPAVNVQNNQSNNKSFLDCIARTIARAAIQQITNSVVNWINSGFNGKPAFIQNYQQFFASVADQAAGSFIQNYTNFAPFCTPFAKQIQSALAQSYARRNVSAPSCTLTKLLGTNIFSGKQAQGWGGLLAMVTNPSNNPFTAYLTAQTGLANAQAAALATANRNITPNGFANYQEAYDCKPAPSGSGPMACKYRTTTPGSVIESQLNKTLGTSLDSLNLAKSFDEILGALITQLMTKALYSGVSNLSGQNGYAGYYLTPDQQQAQTDGQQLLTLLQQLVGAAQQYGQAKQGMIQDIQNTQNQLNALANCWQTAASSTDDVQKQNIAGNNAGSALTQLHAYDAQF
jgi:hypothetical protein